VVSSIAAPHLEHFGGLTSHTSPMATSFFIGQSPKRGAVPRKFGTRARSEAL
jgi:hypothetical protein